MIRDFVNVIDREKAALGLFVTLAETTRAVNGEAAALSVSHWLPQRKAVKIIQRWSYHVWGTVLDEESRPMPHLTVCFVPADRPIAGRIPCTKTGDDGTFAWTVKDIPDKYTVCASTTDSILVLVGEDPSHRVSCSKPMEFGAADDCRKVDLKLEMR